MTGNDKDKQKNGQTNRRWCRGKKDDGSPCKAYPLKGEQYCLLHHPDKRNILLQKSIESREEQAAKDKRRKHFWDNLPEEISEVGDVKELLLRAISEVHEGTLSTNQGSTISALSGHLIKTLELGAMDSRMEWIKQKLRDAGYTEEQIKAKLSGQSKIG